MFLLGDPSSVAQLYFENALAWSGAPRFPSGSVSELGLQDLKNLIAFAYGAYGEALEQGAQPEVLEVLLERYDEAFVALAGASEEFVRLVHKGMVSFAPGIGSRDKYLRLAGRPSES